MELNGIKWLYNNLKSYFEHDGDLLETIKFSFKYAEQLQDDFVIEFYKFVNENYTEICGYYDLKEKSYWNYEKKSINQLLEIFKNK